MAGMLPGVGVSKRRKIYKQLRQDSLCTRCDGPLTVTDRRDPLITCISDLDENALRARQRLQQKLGYLHPSSRSCEILANKSSGINHKSEEKDTRLGLKLSGSQWHLKLRNHIGKLVPFA